MNPSRMLIAGVCVCVSTEWVQATEPLPKMRLPDKNIGKGEEPEHRKLRNPMSLNDWESKPETVPFYDQAAVGERRGQETPSGRKYGRYCENGFLRAGYPNWLGRFAMPSKDACHQVGYVGGGTLFGGSCRRTDQGTFGMDYSGYWFSRKTWLKWSQGERYQGGAGRYETEGPRILPE